MAAAFHPVGALLGFWLATVVARGATSLVRSADLEASTKMADWVLVALVVLVILILSFSGSPDA